MNLTLPSIAALAVLSVATAAVSGGCSDIDENHNAAGGTGGSGGSGGDTASAGGGGVGGMPAPVPTRMTLSGDVTWEVTFDADAIAAGASNCSYTRHYEGVQDQSALWLCPSCEVMFRAEVVMTDGLQTCFGQVSESLPSPTEWVGYGNGAWWRGVGGPMSEQGTAVIDGQDVTTANAVQDIDASVGGTLGFDVSGMLVLGEEQGDPMHGFIVPDSYACGWPTSERPEYTGDYSLVKGGLLPDGLFKDVCEETVRLHDFAGTYLLVDMSAVDCPPCQSWANQEEQFVANMAAQNIEVHVITLMAPSLQDPVGETTTEILDSWIKGYNLTSPVLADRGWGLSMFLPALGGDNTGYPSWVLVAPDLSVIDFGSGFGGFAPHETAILSHAQQ